MEKSHELICKLYLALREYTDEQETAPQKELLNEVEQFMDEHDIDHG